jgi:hypothetical protein
MSVVSIASSKWRPQRKRISRRAAYDAQNLLRASRFKMRRVDSGWIKKKPACFAQAGPEGSLTSRLSLLLAHQLSLLRPERHSVVRIARHTVLATSQSVARKLLVVGLVRLVLLPYLLQFDALFGR